MMCRSYSKHFHNDRWERGFKHLGSLDAVMKMCADSASFLAGFIGARRISEGVDNRGFDAGDAGKADEYGMEAFVIIAAPTPAQFEARYTISHVVLGLAFRIVTGVLANPVQAVLMLDDGKWPPDVVRFKLSRRSFSFMNKYSVRPDEVCVADQVERRFEADTKPRISGGPATGEDPAFALLRNVTLTSAHVEGRVETYKQLGDIAGLQLGRAFIRSGNSTVRDTPA